MPSYSATFTHLDGRLTTEALIADEFQSAVAEAQLIAAMKADVRIGSVMEEGGGTSASFPVNRRRDSSERVADRKFIRV